MIYNKIQRSSQWLGDINIEDFRKFSTTLYRVNPYEELSWRDTFTKSDTYRTIKEIVPKDCKEIWTVSGLPGNHPTAREFQFYQYWNFNTFYYLQPFLNIDDVVYDLGCGGNLFKPYIKNLVGIDPFHPNADINDICDTDFVKGHQNFFKRVFAINSLHFIQLNELNRVIHEFYSMIAPGGIGYISFGLAQMVEFTTDQAWQEIFNKTAAQTTIIEVIQYVDSVLRNLSFKVNIVDQSYFLSHDSRIMLGNEIDGNIRLQLER